MIWDLFHLSGDSANPVETTGLDTFREKRQFMIALRKMKVTRHHENQLQPVEQTIPVLSFTRKTTFFGFLLIVCQLAIVDTYHLLPAGLICYSIGIGLVLELLETPDEYTIWHEMVQHEEEIRHQQELLQRKHFQQQKELFHQEEVRHVQEMVDFEYRVLQGKAKIPRVVARQENGHIMYYTV